MEPDWLAKMKAEGRVTETRVNTNALEPVTRASGEKQTELARVALKGVTEAKFQEIVIDFARSRGWRVAHFRKIRVQRTDGTTFWETPVAADGKGFLDLELVKGKTLLKIELKVPPNKTTPEQDAWIKAYQEAGVTVAVWTPKMWPEIVKILEANTGGS